MHIPLHDADPGCTVCISWVLTDPVQAAMQAANGGMWLKMAEEAIFPALL